MASGEDVRNSRKRRLVAAAAVVGVAVAGAAALAIAARRPAPAAVETSVPGGQLLAPLATARDATGEEVAPFDGFAVSVETDPPGAVVTVAGIARGESPAFAGVDCEPGEDVRIQAALPGRVTAVRSTRCRSNALVKVRLALRPAAR